MKPTFKEAFLFWLRLGFISFGGPAGQIAIMHEFLVEKKKWISEQKFFHALNYCMLLPGPEAQQLATYIGWLLHGVRGGLIAGILFVLPSVFILMALSIIYVSFGTVPYVAALFAGLKPAVLAIIIIALLKISQKSLHSFYHYLFCLVSFISIFFLNIPFPFIILTAIIIGTILLFKGRKENKNSHPEKTTAEEGYYLATGRVIPGTEIRKRRIVFQILTGLILWCTPLVFFYLLSSDFPFWRQLNLFFTQAALVTFGGAYAVLPYVAQVTVEKLHWLSKWEMIDGLALGESTPGPLIMVLAFVGFTAGYHHFNDSILSGCIGLLTTTFYTFLPCFLFIFIGGPFIEKTQNNPEIKKILSYVTAAIVGVILNLTIYLGVAILFPEGIAFKQLHLFNLAWIGVSLIGLYKLKWNMILWLGLSAIAGLGHYILSHNW